MLQLGECRWSKAGKPVGMFGGKYELRGDTGAGDCSLTLHTVDLRIDDGQWQCQVGIIFMGDYLSRCGTFDNSMFDHQGAFGRPYSPRKRMFFRFSVAKK